MKTISYLTYSFPLGFFEIIGAFHIGWDAFPAISILQICAAFVGMTVMLARSTFILVNANTLLAHQTYNEGFAMKIFRPKNDLKTSLN